MLDLLLDHPRPDFDEFTRVLKGEQAPRRVHLIELGIDPEVLQVIQETYLGEHSVLLPGVYVPDRPDEEFYRQLVNLYYRLGYDFTPLWPMWINCPDKKVRLASDTAGTSRVNREWVDETDALISSRAEFDAFPWDKIYSSMEIIEMAGRYLPDGMKLVVSACLFEEIFENLLGAEGLFYKLTDDPQLVEDTFNRWGQIVYDYYASVIVLDSVGGIFHADDKGFKTGTLISPADLRRLLFPWLSKYVALAHAHNKPFVLHSCGNLYKKSPSVMDDLIDLVKIDGFHSFQDVILPIEDAKNQYGNRVALLGGVDMDKLATLSEPDLRTYIRGILAACMPGGRFALGSGNTVANYVPMKNYAIMLEEARRWK
jgi:uroporphyrinogen decarboxylase